MRKKAPKATNGVDRVTCMCSSSSSVGSSFALGTKRIVLLCLALSALTIHLRLVPRSLPCFCYFCFCPSDLSLIVVVEFPQLALDVLEFLLCLGNDGLEVLKADLHVGLVVCARLVLVCAIVLDLFAAVLDLGQAECCATALEEVAEGTELSEVLLLTASQKVSRGSEWRCF